MILKFLLPVAAFGFLALARSREQPGNGPPGASGHRRLGHGAIPRPAEHGHRLPGALVFDPLYRLPLGWLLREPGRFLMLGGLAYAVLLALATQAACERLNAFMQRGEWRWNSALRRQGLGLAAIGAAVLAPAFPLMTGAIAPDHRPLLPSVHVSVPAYWTAMASYLNSRAQPGNLRVLPEDDFYQMPYTWGYYGADGFITDLIARNVVDPVAQGYAPAPQELRGAVRLVRQGLLAHDWPSVRRTLAALGTPLALVRGDVNAAFPDRHITAPAALDKALWNDKDIRLVHRAGQLELFALRKRISPPGSVTSYATVNSATPDLRDLALFPPGTALISSPMHPAVPSVLQLPPVSRWRLAGDKLETFVAEPPGLQYRIKLLSATGAFQRPGASSARPRRLGTPRAGSHRRPTDRPSLPTRRPRSRQAGRTGKRPAWLSARVRHRNGQVVEELSYKLGGSLLSDGDFASGSWGLVGNCAAFPGTVATARLAARVLPGQGPLGLPALALSAHADSACAMRSLAWRSGPLFVSLWARNVSGAAPRMCLWQMPIKMCAAMSPFPRSSALSRWYHYQAIVTPDPGTRSLALFLYSDVYTPGARTTNDYSDVVVRRSPLLLQPAIVATPRRHERPAPALYTVDESFSPDWIGPPGDQHVEVDGLHNGWVGPHSREVPRFGPSSWYLLSRFASLLAAGLLLALALSCWPGGRHRISATVRTARGGRKRVLISSQQVRRQGRSGFRRSSGNWE